MFLFALTLFFLIMLSYFTFGIYKANTKYITKNADITDECYELGSFEVINSRYFDNKLSLAINNPSTKQAINSVTIIYDDQEIKKNTTIAVSSIGSVIFEEIIINSNQIRIYPNLCEDKQKQINI